MEASILKGEKVFYSECGWDTLAVRLHRRAILAPVQISLKTEVEGFCLVILFFMFLFLPLPVLNTLPFRFAGLIHLQTADANLIPYTPFVCSFHL